MSTTLLSPSFQLAPVLPKRYEVVDGVVVEKAPMSVRSSLVASKLVEIMAPFVTSRGLGTVVSEMLFRLETDPDLQRRPDVAFVSAAKWPPNREAPEAACWDMVPDVAIEVNSPTNQMDKVMDKLDEYLQAGVKKVWIVLPLKKRIFIFDSPTGVRALSRAETLEDPVLLPGFQLPLAQLFPEATS